MSDASYFTGLMTDSFQDIFDRYFKEEMEKAAKKGDNYAYLCFCHYRDKEVVDQLGRLSDWLHAKGFTFERTDDPNDQYNVSSYNYTITWPKPE